MVGCIQGGMSVDNSSLFNHSGYGQVFFSCFSAGHDQGPLDLHAKTLVHFLNQDTGLCLLLEEH